MPYGRIAGIGKGTTSFTMSNTTAIWTMNNELIICDDITNVTASNGTVIYTFPSHFPRPLVDRQVGIFRDGSFSRFVFNTSGEIVATGAFSNGKVYTSGLYLQLNTLYYNDTIGNNDENDMTSPLMYE